MTPCRLYALQCVLSKVYFYREIIPYHIRKCYQQKNARAPQLMPARILILLYAFSSGSSIPMSTFTSRPISSPARLPRRHAGLPRNRHGDRGDQRILIALARNRKERLVTKYKSGNRSIAKLLPAPPVPPDTARPSPSPSRTRSPSACCRRCSHPR